MAYLAALVYFLVVLETGEGAKINQPCSEKNVCVQGPNGTPLVCDPYRSICVIQVYKPCTNMENSCPTGATCTAGVCKCQSNYDHKDAICRRVITTLGASCKPFEKCDSDDHSVPDMSCDALARQCLIENGKTCKGYADMCMTGATCTQAQTCACQPSYTQDKHYCRSGPGKLGGTCNTGTNCIDANAACTDGVCLCQDGYRYKRSDASCEVSGVGRTTASALVLVSASLLYRLLLN